MGVLLKVLAVVSRLRRVARFRLWLWRSRLRLVRAGCRLEVHAPHGLIFDTSPVVEPTWQLIAEGGGGSLRIELGRSVNLGRDTTIEVLPSADNLLVLDDSVVCEAGARFTLFGGELRVGSWSNVRDGALLKSSGRLVCGEHATVGRQASVQADNDVILGDHVGLGAHVVIMDSDHRADGSDTPFLEQPVASDPIHVGRNVLIGSNVVITRGARIGVNAIVAAGSVVRAGEYPAGSLIAGVPARVRRSLSDATAGRRNPG